MKKSAAIGAIVARVLATQPVLRTSTGLAATNARALPDIAMAADPNAGRYRDYGAKIPGSGDCSLGCAVGGTSEASLLAMSVYARILSAHVNEHGFAAPYLYTTYLQNQNDATTVTGPPPMRTLGGFRDILTGSNGAYSALPATTTRRASARSTSAS